VPVCVSYKKQFILMIMLLVTLLIVVEIFVNIWLYNFYRCDFEQSEIFSDIDKETKRKICVEGFESDLKKATVPCMKGTVLGTGAVAEACGGFDKKTHFTFRT